MTPDPETPSCLADPKTNPWINRFTRTGSSRLGRHLNEIDRRLVADGGLRLQQDRSFRRIQLYRLVRAQAR